MKAKRPVFLLMLVVSLILTNTAFAAAVPSWGDPSIPYGQRFDRLVGDLSRSGLAGIDERPAILDSWEAYFVDVVANKTLDYLDKYDVFDIQEVYEGDEFTDRRGYGC